METRVDFGDARVVITGASGFVGGYLAARLMELGSTIYGIDRWKSEPARLLEKRSEDSKGNFKPVSGNLRDISSLANVIAEAQPDYVFHLAAQSFVPESFRNPVDTMTINSLGTCNLLEAARKTDSDAVIVFAGSSEQYGLVLTNENQYRRVLEKYGSIFPEPEKIPELPISEKNPLRPMSPYAVSKVSGDFMSRNYYHVYGLPTIVSRAFNHEGAGRGENFVTSIITRQVAQLQYGERESIVLGNVEAFRDWSHVSDIVEGYLLLATKGKFGEVYNQGSQRTNSVLAYLLLSLEMANKKPTSLKTLNDSVKMDNPAELEETEQYGLTYPTTFADRQIMDGTVSFNLEDKGLLIETEKGPVQVDFNPERFRPAEVPILLADCAKIQNLGFEVQKSL
ncbi:MAG: GDP-mannose 4,6-dehydratase, partial [Candidatus Thorarchaeota archaeon]|nr:GDP-mannose 4,6-dehydratase [Candidatus Thorarchaeota archaeon]